jgi:hypothetical protein
MAIDTIKLSWRGQDSEASSDLGGENRQRAGRLLWTITCTDPENDNAVSIHQEAAENYGYKVGKKHPHDDAMYATSFRTGRIQPGLFLLEGFFTARGDVGENPLLEPADVKINFSTQQAEFDQDIDGNPICTKNGEGYTVTDDISDLVLTVRRNLEAFDDAIAWQYMHRGATNSDTFRGYPPGTCRMRGLDGDRVNGEDFIYWSVTGIIQVRSAAPGSSMDKAWYARHRHEGYRERIALGGGVNAVVQAIDAEQQPVTAPVLLDIDGYQITDPTAAIWQEWKMAPSLPFASLGFF